VKNNFKNLHGMEERIVFVIKNWACLRKCNYFTKLNGIPISMKWFWELNEDICVSITNRKPVTQQLGAYFNIKQCGAMWILSFSLSFIPFYERLYFINSSKT